MSTLQQEYLRRLRAEQEARMRQRLGDSSDLSDAVDLIIGIVSAIGVTVMLVAGIVWWLV